MVARLGDVRATLLGLTSRVSHGQAGDLGRAALKPHFLPLRLASGGTCIMRCSQWGRGQCRRGLGTAGSCKRSVSVSVGFIRGQPPGLHSRGKHPSECRGGLSGLIVASRPHSEGAVQPLGPVSFALWKGGSAHVLTAPCWGRITESVW